MKHSHYFNPGLKSPTPSLSSPLYCAVAALQAAFRHAAKVKRRGLKISHMLQGRQSAPGARQSPLQPVIEHVSVKSRANKVTFLIQDSESSQPEYTAVLCSGSTTSCLLYGQTRAEVRTHMYRRAVRVLHEPGRVPSSMLSNRNL